MSFHPLDEAILKTVILFDLADYPLTSFEIWQYLYHPPKTQISFSELLLRLETSETLKEILDCAEGMYYLKGRVDLINLRKLRYRASIKKWKKSKWFVKLLRAIPFLRAAALCNALGYGNAKPLSDIDLFIIARPGTLWTTRLLAVIFSLFFGGRPHPGASANTFCLSFFVSETKNMAKLNLPGSDPLFGIWAARIFPFLDQEDSVRKFFSQNSWLKEVYPNALVPRLTPLFRVSSLSVVSKLLEFIFSFPSRRVVEAFAKTIARVFGNASLWAVANRDTKVIMNDEVLKLHVNDNRAQYRRAFENKWRQVVSGASWHPMPPAVQDTVAPCQV